SRRLSARSVAQNDASGTSSVNRLSQMSHSLSSIEDKLCEIWPAIFTLPYAPDPSPGVPSTKTASGQLENSLRTAPRGSSQGLLKLFCVRLGAMIIASEPDQIPMQTRCEPDRNRVLIGF